MEKQKKIFLICPVREADEVLKKLLNDYVAKLEASGYKVHYPTRDTEQNDPSGGYQICRTNFTSILNADEIHIWYDESSNGSKFDMGGVFMLHLVGLRKKVVIANEGLILAEPKQKSFLRVMRRLIGIHGLAIPKDLENKGILTEEQAEKVRKILGFKD